MIDIQDMKMEMIHRCKCAKAIETNAESPKKTKTEINENLGIIKLIFL